MFWHEYAKIPRHASQNPIAEGDFSWILTRNCEGTEQLRNFFIKPVCYRYFIIVETANDGVACIDMVEKAEADYYKMILMDIQMPVMNGYDATLAIRKMKDTKKARIPIVAMTANAFAEDIQNVLSVGMNDHVAKPVDMNILVSTMMKYL